jgi:hypothetical protein
MGTLTGQNRELSDFICKSLSRKNSLYESMGGRIGGSLLSENVLADDFVMNAMQCSVSGNGSDNNAVLQPET